MDHNGPTKSQMDQNGLWLLRDFWSCFLTQCGFKCCSQSVQGLIKQTLLTTPTSELRSNNFRWRRRRWKAPWLIIKIAFCSEKCKCLFFCNNDCFAYSFMTINAARLFCHLPRDLKKKNNFKMAPFFAQYITISGFFLPPPLIKSFTRSNSWFPDFRSKSSHQKAHWLKQIHRIVAKTLSPQWSFLSNFVS